MPSEVRNLTIEVPVTLSSLRDAALQWKVLRSAQDDIAL